MGREPPITPRRPRRPRRGFRLTLSGLASTSLLLLGLVLGLGGGLYYAWVLSPIVYTAASPARLRADLRADYLLLVSQSYGADGDLNRARARLQALNVPDSGALVLAQLETALRTGRPAAEVRQLARLAQALGVQAEAVALFAPTPAAPPVTTAPTPAPATATPTLLPTLTPTASPTSTPTPSPTLRPSATPSPTAEPAYRLLSQERACVGDRAHPVIEVITLDALLEPLPGVEVLVSWDSGEDHFFTGFKPAGGPGYGDFTMSSDTSYTVILAAGSPPVSGLRLEPCPAAAGGHPGGWRLTYQNLQVGVTPDQPDG